MTKIHLQDKLRPSNRQGGAIAENRQIEILRARIKVLEKALVALDKDYQALRAKK